MRPTSSWLLALSGALFLAVCAHAQEEGKTGQMVVVQSGVPGMGPSTVAAFGGQVELLGFGGIRGNKVVKGAPFSAVAVSETKQTLADGTNITHKFQSNLYRDSEGRFRKESTLPAIGPLAASGKARSFVTLMDPVLGASYALDPDKKIAHKLPDRKGGPREFPPGGDVRFEAGPGGVVKYERINSDADANVKKESLGTQTINGVVAEGTRYTRTIPVGQIGNDRALTIVKEEWYSPDLQMVVQSRHTDPMFGQTVYSVTNIQRTPPDPNLFVVPSNYTIKEGHGLRMFTKRGHMEKGEMPVPPPDSPDSPPDPER